MHRRFSFAVVIAMLVAASCAGTAEAASYTWQGGDGNWTAANWTTSAGVNQSWASNNTAIFTSGTQTLTLSGNVEFDLTSLRFVPTETLSLTVNSGTLSRSSDAPLNFYNNTGGSFPATLTFTDVALRGSSFEIFGTSLTKNLTVVFNAMRNSAEGSTIRTINVAANNTLRISSTGNLPDSVKAFTMGVDSTIDTFVPITIADGTLNANLRAFINTNGNAFSVANWIQPSSVNRGPTITGSGTFSATKMTLRSGTSFKAGDATVVINDVVTDGVSTPTFRWEGGTNIVNGTTPSLGNWSLFSGATLGGSGTLSFAPGSVLSGSAGSFFTADMTAGGLDIQGTLALSQSGSGVTMRLSGPLPLTGTTTLMNWTTLSTGTFRTITYFTGTSLVTLTPDVESPALNGGMVSYTAVPNALVFIAVPEPATICLLAGGAAILGGREIRRRRRAASS